jgi:hypothetical protein
MEGTMETFDMVFDGVPYSGTAARHWAKQDRELLNSAAAKIESHGANPWVFTGDLMMFEQFSGEAERAVLRELTIEEGNALLHWYEEYWGPGMD